VINHATHYTPPLLPRSQQADSQRTMLHPHMVMAESIHGIYKKRRGFGWGTMELLNKKPQKEFQPGAPKLSTPLHVLTSSLCQPQYGDSWNSSGFTARPLHWRPSYLSCFFKRPLPPYRNLCEQISAHHCDSLFVPSNVPNAPNHCMNCNGQHTNCTRGTQ